jgi:hypothetical protein
MEPRSVAPAPGLVCGKEIVTVEPDSDAVGAAVARRVRAPAVGDVLPGVDVAVRKP